MVLSFTLTKDYRSKRQLSKSFTVAIQPLLTHLIKRNFCIFPDVSLDMQMFKISTNVLYQLLLLIIDIFRYRLPPESSLVSSRVPPHSPESSDLHRKGESKHVPGAAFHYRCCCRRHTQGNAQKGSLKSTLQTKEV